jgi:carbamate kinase
MLPDNQRGLQSEQMRNARKAAELMVHIVRKGYELIIVHGNGPQVGNLLIQMEEAVTKIPPYSLDLCDAMTEGSMGFMLERAITLPARTAAMRGQQSRPTWRGNYHHVNRWVCRHLF